MRCAVNDSECSLGRLRRGLCEKHYRRALHTGTTASPRINNLTHYTVSESGCWIWNGARYPNGYGKLSAALHGTRIAHRAFYIEHIGPVARGKDIDHRCHNADPDCVRGWDCPHRACVNPDHLEPVPHVDNLVRAIQSRPMCENGLHDLTKPGATKGNTRQCVACWRIRYRAAGLRYREKRKS